MTTAIKRAAVIWASAGALLLAWSGLAAGVNAGSDDNYDERRQIALKQQQFWSIVAGEQGAPVGVFGKLASDLRDLEIEKLGGFRGDSNRYGGISEELGFDPFNGTNCSECGPLDQEVINTVVDVKSGRLGVVLTDLQPEEPDTAPHPPGWLWILWVIAGPASLGGIYLVDKRREERKYSEFGEEMALVRSLERASEDLPWEQAHDIANLRKKLKESIDQRIRYGEEEARTLRTQELLREAEETLEALREGNRALGN